MNIKDDTEASEGQMCGNFTKKYTFGKATFHQSITVRKGFNTSTLHFLDDENHGPFYEQGMPPCCSKVHQDVQSCS